MGSSLELLTFFGLQNQKEFLTLRFPYPNWHTALAVDYLENAEQRTTEILLPLIFAAQRESFWNNQAKLFGCFGFQSSNSMASCYEKKAKKTVFLRTLLVKSNCSEGLENNR